MPTSPRQTIGRPHTAPPWGLSEPTTPAQQSGEISTLRPRTRTEMLSLRREELQLLARGCQEKALREEAEGAATEIRPHWGEGVDWWTLADGYRENAFEAFVRYHLVVVNSGSILNRSSTPFACEMCSQTVSPHRSELRTAAGAPLQCRSFGSSLNLAASLLLLSIHKKRQSCNVQL